MNVSRISLSLIALSLLTLPARAQDEKKTPLGEQMSGIAKDFRTLRKQIKDPAQKDSSLQLVKDMEDHAAKAKTLDPAKTKDIPEADREKFLADYRKSIDGLSDQFQKLEADIKDGKMDEAAAALDQIQNAKREGHKKFNADNH